MGTWAGFRSPEFGTCPVDLQFSVDSHVGPSWVVPAIVNRSGWLAAAEVEMETAFDRTTEIVCACTDENGEVMGKWVSDALFSMHCGLPSELNIEPPDELDDAIDALYWDFLGRCDIAHLRLLEEKEQLTTNALSRLESRRRDVYEKVDVFLSSLHARRRRESDDRELCAVIDAKIAEVEEKNAAAETWHHDRLAKVSRELRDFDTHVMASLQNHGRVTKLYTVHWAAKPSRKKQLRREELIGYARPVFVRAFDWDKSAKVTSDLVSRSRNPKIYGTPEFWALEHKRDVDESRAIVQDDKARDTTKLLLSIEQVRPTAAVNIKKHRTVATKQAATRDWKPETKKVTRAEIDAAQLAVIREKLIDSERDKRLREKVAEDNMRRALERELMTALAEDAELELAANKQAAQALVLANTPMPAQFPVVAVDHPAQVILGDRVLLRFEDLNRARIQYTLGDKENDFTKGILASSDARAKAILGRKIGDRVSLQIGGKERFAVIEQILNFDREIIA